jgi:CDGSH-type Zn-finger protein
MPELEIRYAARGPYLIKGPLVVVAPDGERSEIEAGKTAALCRCGASTTKPFCDGTHSRIGFLAAESAVEEEGAGA